MTVTLVLCLLMVLLILSFSLTLSIFLSMASWLVSSFFTNAHTDELLWQNITKGLCAFLQFCKKKQKTKTKIVGVVCAEGLFGCLLA